MRKGQGPADLLAHSLRLGRCCGNCPHCPTSSKSMAGQLGRGKSEELYNAGTSASSILRSRMPESPAAPPRRASRKAAATAVGPSWTCPADCCSTTARGMGVRGSGGRRAGSVNARHVSSLPGASSAAVRSWRALESSPALTFVQACSRLHSATVSASKLCAPDWGRQEPARCASSNSSAQSPRWNAAARASNS